MLKLLLLGALAYPPAPPPNLALGSSEAEVRSRIDADPALDRRGGGADGSDVIILSGRGEFRDLRAAICAGVLVQTTTYRGSGLHHFVEEHTRLSEQLGPAVLEATAARTSGGPLSTLTASWKTPQHDQEIIFWSFGDQEAMIHTVKTITPLPEGCTPHAALGSP